ncbi:metallophosphoesterase [Salidesulfovibrio onnuriiensis]|uniref:metallophosphoesterase n=1 Tax=Salidesulfovibrio onnuriiensis TaxID=2583823 RepID=UPI0011C75632|nr:metallophosphoesterase [Salidesulfovibrio onnuriiensis]
MWLLIVLSVSACIIGYLGWRIISPLPLSPRKRLLLWLLLAAVILGQRVTWFIRANGHNPALLDAVDWVGFVTLGFISFVIVLSLARDGLLLLRWFLGLFRRVRPNQRKIFFKGPDPSRRRFLVNVSNAVILTAAVPLTAYSIHEARRMPDIVRVDMAIKNLPADLDGFTIVQLSDTHVGPTIKGDWIARCVKMVNDLKPDMIVHTGDMIDGHALWLHPDVKPFEDLRAPYGKYFVTGNHEYYSGVDSWLETIAGIGMKPLVNEHVLVQKGDGRILLAGVPDFKAYRMKPSHVSSPAKAREGAPEHDVSILLAHQPKSVFQASKAGYDIQLSGHTHGGQFFPWTEVIRCFQPYVRGLHDVDGTKLYVNKGTGYWGPPLRLGAPPEITLITLRREK